MAICISIFSNLTISGYGTSLGFSISQISLSIGLMLFCQNFSLVAPWLAGIFNSRKSLAVKLRLFSSLSFVLLAITAVFDSMVLKTPFFTVIVTLQTILMAISTALVRDWQNTIIVNDVKSGFIKKYSNINTTTSLITLVFSGILLDILSSPLNFQILLSISSLFCLASVATLLLKPELPYSPVPKKQLSISFKKDIDQRKKNSLTFTSIFHFGFYMINALLFVYFIKELKISFFLCSVCAMLSFLCARYFTKGWLSLASQFGAKNVLIFCVILSSITSFLAIAIATQAFVIPIFIAITIKSSCFSAVSILSAKLEDTKRLGSNRLKHGSNLALVKHLSGAIGIIVGGILIDQLFGMGISWLFGNQWMSFQLIFLFASLIQLISILPLLSKSIPQRRKFREMLPYVIPTFLNFKTQEVKVNNEDEN